MGLVSVRFDAILLTWLEFAQFVKLWWREPNAEDSPERELCGIERYANALKETLSATRTCSRAPQAVRSQVTPNKPAEVHRLKQDIVRLVATNNPRIPRCIPGEPSKGRQQAGSTYVCRDSTSRPFVKVWCRFAGRDGICERPALQTSMASKASSTTSYSRYPRVQQGHGDRPSLA
jgi:hypothetical protein